MTSSPYLLDPCDIRLYVDLLFTVYSLLTYHALLPLLPLNYLHTQTYTHVVLIAGLVISLVLGWLQPIYTSLFIQRIIMITHW